MPWKETTVLTQHNEFIRLSNRPETNMSQRCQRYGISRKTGHLLVPIAELFP